MIWATMLSDYKGNTYNLAIFILKWGYHYLVSKKQN